MLTLENVSLSFPQKQNVIDHLSLTLEPGQIVGLVAPNGTGKTTLLNVILNDLHPASGSVAVDGVTYANQKKTRSLHHEICAFPLQEDLFGDLSGLEHLRFYASSWGADPKRLPRIIATLQMGNYVQQPVRTYSLGMRQRLCFAMVVAADSPIMLLDELMNGLDPVNVELVSQVLLHLKRRGKLLLMVSHLLPNLEVYADQVLFMQDGQVALTVKPQAARTQFVRIPQTSLDADRQKQILTGGAKQIGANFFLPAGDLEKVLPLLANADHTYASFAIGPQSLVDHYYALYHQDISQL